MHNFWNGIGFIAYFWRSKWRSWRTEPLGLYQWTAIQSWAAQPFSNISPSTLASGDIRLFASAWNLSFLGTSVEYDFSLSFSSTAGIQHFLLGVLTAFVSQQSDRKWGKVWPSDHWDKTCCLDQTDLCCFEIGSTIGSRKERESIWPREPQGDHLGFYVLCYLFIVYK